MTTFTGFPKDAIGFFHELGVEMNRDWFAANKARYETQWVEPMTALLADVTARLAKPYAPLKLGAPKVMRIYRDVRFSKDKAPYKTHISGVISVGNNTAMYIHIGSEEEFIGCGCYYFDPKKLVKWRKLVAGKYGAALATIVAKLRKAGYTIGGHGDYKKVPKPYADDHPRAEFLKMRGLTGGFPDIPARMLHKPQLADWLVEHGKAMVPFVTWLQRNVG